jgi:hypothetical protein
MKLLSSGALALGLANLPATLAWGSKSLSYEISLDHELTTHKVSAT